MRKAVELPLTMTAQVSDVRGSISATPRAAPHDCPQKQLLAAPLGE